MGSECFCTHRDAAPPAGLQSTHVVVVGILFFFSRVSLRADCDATPTKPRAGSMTAGAVAVFLLSGLEDSPLTPWKPATPLCSSLTHLWPTHASTCGPPPAPYCSAPAVVWKCSAAAAALLRGGGGVIIIPAGECRTCEGGLPWQMG